MILFQVAASQNIANNWLFDNLGLEFLQDTVLIRNDYAVHNRGAAGTISDKNGQMLFYTDGMSVWDRNHNLMPNGRYLILNGGSFLPTKSMIIPKPGSDSIFYIFSIGVKTTLYCSTVDLSLNNGLGDVIDKNKNLLNVQSNKMTAVFYENHKDVWLIVHQHKTSNYFSFLISETGISETPVLSSVGKDLPSAYGGQLKASPDGQKVAISYGLFTNGEGFSLFDFNHSTGILSNPRVFQLPVLNRGCDGLEFSPDGTKVFVHQSGSTGESGMYQFDISGPSFDDINNSRVYLMGEHYNTLEDMQLAPNGKIYITKGGGSGGTAYLGVITHPNENGLDCIVKENGLYLEGGDGFVFSTPLFNQSYFFKTSFLVDNTCRGNVADFRISNETGLDSAKWDLGDGRTVFSLNPQIIYSKEGNYVVRLFAFYPEKVDTIIKTITINPSPEFDLGEDRVVCQGYDLSAPDGFKSYRWNTGDSTRTVFVRTSGNYSVSVENSYGCIVTDSVNLTIAELPVIELQDSVQMGAQDSIQLCPGNFNSYYWSTGDTSSTLFAKDVGWYSVTVENSYGCTATKSFYIGKETSVTTDFFNGWNVLNPEPSPYHANDICFINSQIGFVINDSQLIKTTDRGTSWSIFMPLLSGKHIAFKDDYGYIIGDNGCIYKSTFMGGGWSKLNVSFTENLKAITVISKDTVLITGTGTLYTSFDGGESWKSNIVRESNMLSSCFLSSTVGYVGCYNGVILRTVDGGITWNNVSIINSTNSTITKIYFVDEKIGFAICGNRGVLKTTDGGESWSPSQETIDVIYSVFFLNPSEGFVAGDYGRVYKTSDGGASWDLFINESSYYYTDRINAVYFFDNLTGFAVGKYGRIMKTSDGGKNWKDYASTHNSIKQLEFVTDQVGYGLADNKFIKTTDGGKTWINLGTPLVNCNTVKFDFVNENLGYCIAGGEYGEFFNVGKVCKTTDGGKTWTTTNKGVNVVYENLYTICFTDEKTGYVSGATGGIAYSTFKTTDGGDTWTSLNKLIFSHLRFMNDSVGYALSGATIYKTNDFGQNWMVIFSLSNYETSAYSINAFHFIDEHFGVLICDHSTMFRTLDGGVSWQKVTTPDDDFLNAIIITPNVYYLTDIYGGLYCTSNAGYSWDVISKPYDLSSMIRHGDKIVLYGGNGLIMEHPIDYQPVSLKVDAASAVSNRSAIVSGIVASNEGVIDDIRMEYGIGNLNNVIMVQTDSVLQNTTQKISAELRFLKPGSRYEYRLTSFYKGIQYYSDILEFRTLDNYEISINFLGTIYSNEAKVTGYLVSNEDELQNVEFQYGTDTTFGSSVSAQPNLIIGKSSAYVSANLTSLKPLTRYLVRLKAEYNGIPVYSGLCSFMTRTEYNVVLYSPYYDEGGITFRGYIEAYRDTARNIVFEYGTTLDLKNKLTSDPNVAPKGSSEYVYADVTGLDSTSLYYYRLKADFGKDVIYSKEGIMKMKKDVLFSPLEIMQLSDSSVQVQLYLNSNEYFINNIKLRYGLSESFTDSLSAVPSFTWGSSTYKMIMNVDKLELNKKYHFRVTATDGIGNYSSDETIFMLTSTDCSQMDSQVSIYPNPTTDFIYLRAIKPIQSIDVMDSFGRNVYKGSDEKKINFSTFPSGIYLIKIISGNKQIIKKIIKN